MWFHPVVDRFWVAPQLDPASLVLFAALFVATVLATRYRPSWGALALIAVPPFTWDHVVFGTTVSLPKVVVLGVCAGLAAHPAAFAELRRVRLVLVAFAAMLGAIALSAWGAEYRSDVFREFLKWVEYALFFGAAYLAIAVDPRTRLVEAAYKLSIAVVCAGAIAELFTGAASGMWINGAAIPRIAGVLDGPNQLAGYLESAIAALAALSLRIPRRTTYLVLALAFLTLTLTFSRAAFIGVIIIAVILLIFEGRRLWPALASSAIGLGIAAALTSLMLKHTPTHDVGELAVRASDTTGAATGGLGTRSELWRAALYFFRHHPVFGIGAGNYELRLPEAGLPTIRTHANSWYLQALAEGGIVLFAATLFFIGSMLALLWRNARTSPWALAAFAATIALALHQVVDYLVFYPKVAEPWMLLCAIGLADSRSPR